MKTLFLTTALVLFSTCMAIPAQAQPIESEPLAPLEIKPVTEARPLDNVRQDDTPVTPPVMLGSDPATQQPSSTLPAYPAQSTGQPIPTIVPYGGSIGSAPKEKDMGQKKFCSLQVSFASACCGPDTKTAEVMKTYLDANPDKMAYTKSSWGREGEFTYCIDVPDHRNRGKTYTTLKKMVTDKPVRNKPVTLSGEGFIPVNNAKSADAR